MSESALDRAHALAMRWQEQLDARPVGAQSTLSQLRDTFCTPLPDEGMDAVEVTEWLYGSACEGMVGSSGGRFFAWVIGGRLDSALAADWLVSTWDQNAALYACSPAAAVIEEAAGEWLKELLELPEDCSFAFTTGCQMAHTTALAGARNAVLRRIGWDVESHGLCGAPAVKVLCSDQKHGSIVRSVRLLGLGASSLRDVATDDSGRMKKTSLEAALKQDSSPTIVILNAADLNVGAFDDFQRLIPAAHDAGAWVHVDGAFGLFARASARHRNKTLGIERADSWALDAHKWLNVPFDCGIAFVRDREAHLSAMTLAASYISAQSGARDQIDWNPEWSRRARGIPVYAALKELGRKGVEHMIDHCCTCCCALVEGIGALRGAEVVAHPTLNQGLVRFRCEGNDAEEDDTLTDRIIERVNLTGEAFFSGTTWRGRRTMRVSVVNRCTGETDVARAIEAVARALRENSTPGHSEP